MDEAMTEGAAGSLSRRMKTLRRSLAPRYTEVKNSFHLLRRSPIAMIGLVIFLVIILMAVFAPFLAPPYHPDEPLEMPRSDRLDPMPPGAEGYVLGTGKNGVDIYYGVIWGARTSVWIGLYVVLVSAVLGIVIGAIAGFYGGIIDEVLMRVTDVFLSIPSLILTMAVMVALRSSDPTFTEALNNLMLSLIIVWWPAYARLIRGQVLSIKENTYVEAARAVGAKKSRVLFRHIVPNSLSPLYVSATMDMGAVVLVAAALSFIGFVPTEGIAEWGKMVSDGQEYFFLPVEYNGEFITAWWVATIPGLMIFLFVMGFNLLGDGLRDIMDPRLRRG